MWEITRRWVSIWTTPKNKKQCSFRKIMSKCFVFFRDLPHPCIWPRGFCERGCRTVSKYWWQSIASPEVAYPVEKTTIHIFGCNEQLREIRKVNSSKWIIYGLVIAGGRTLVIRRVLLALLAALAALGGLKQHRLHVAMRSRRQFDDWRGKKKTSQEDPINPDASRKETVRTH